jgi:PIN domain nuclease of toxin-antitoxin system
MNCLIDTHILLWSAITPSKLTAQINGVLLDSENRIVVSAITFWEIALKYAAGRLDIMGLAPEDFPRIASELGFETINLTAEDASGFHQLPVKMHRDPFDRMLAWQAIRHELTLITADPAFHEYRSHGLRLL